MLSRRNVAICLLLVAGAHAHAMDHDKVSVALTKSQADTIKEEVDSHFNRSDEKYYVIPHKVMHLIENNPEINSAFNEQKLPVSPPDTLKSRLAWFNAVVDKHVKENQ